jgi:hypothetical protein
MEHELVLNLKELHIISIECSKCHSQFTVDLDSNISADSMSALSKCPYAGCEAQWFGPARPGGSEHAILRYIRSFQQLRGIEEPKVTFRLKMALSTGLEATADRVA